MDRREMLCTTAAAGSLLLLGEHLHAAPARSPFLQGNFAPVHEEVTVEKLPIRGKIPAQLQGMFVRNGPNPQFDPIAPYHWFDGDGMLHGLRIHKGKASYRNRYIQTAGYKEEKKEGKSLYTGLMSKPDFKKIAKSGEPGKNNGNTALIHHHGKFLALWEGGAPHEITLPDLGTKGRYDFAGKLKHPCTAHPKIDPETGEMIFFGYGPFPPYLHHTVVNSKGAITHTTPVKLPRPVMMHDFAVTKRYSIFLDLPEVFDIAGMFLGKPMLRFEPSLGARIGVMPRHGKGADTKWFEIPPCFVVHTLNAWEDEDEVVLLACRMPEFSMDLQLPEKMIAKKKLTGRLTEWRLNMKTGKVKQRELYDQPSDFPRFDERFMGRKIRYGYSMHLTMDAYFKHDFEKGTVERHDLGKGRFGGEGVFVPNPNGKTEDDGWLLTYVYDAAREKSELVIIDTRAFNKPAVARILLPVRVPYGFHGAWIDDQRL